MELKIEIDENRFKDVIEKELMAFSKDEMHDLLKQMVLQYAKSESCKMDQLFIKEQLSGGYYGDRKYVPGPVLEKYMNDLDLSEELEPVKKAVLKNLIENHREIAENALWRCVKDNIFNDTRFNAAIGDAINYILANKDMKNNV